MSRPFRFTTLSGLLAHYLIRLLVPVVFIIAFVQQAQAQTTSPLDGIWKYINPGRAGQAFYLNGRYVFFYTRTDITMPEGNLPDSTRVRLFNGMILDAGTFTVSDTLVTAKSEYSKVPRRAPLDWRWSFSLKGDTCTYHVLNAQGQWTGTGRAVRVHTGK